MSETFLPHDWFPRPLPSNVEIGPRCWLYSTFAFVHYRSQQPLGLRVGHDTGLYHGTFFDIGPNGVVEVGHYCSIVGAIIATNGHVQIGNYTFIAHEVVLADRTTATPPGTILSSQEPGPSKRIVIGSNVWIGARAILIGEVEIGEGAIIGAAAVVSGRVPAYSVYAGNPGRVVRKAGDSVRP